MEKEKEITTLPLVRVGISIGDINGIGPEVILKAFQDNRMLLDCTPLIYANSKVFGHLKKAMGDQEFSYQSCKSAEEAQPRKINMIHAWSEDIQPERGMVTEVSGQCAFQSLERATTDLAEGKIDVLVTAPISKEAMAKTGFSFPGHTEYLANLAGTDEVLMVMTSGELRVALATTHIPLKEVHTALTKELILGKIKLFETSLKKDFGLVRPKIAVLGLNPHAGENGKIGTEESETIIPAINSAKIEGILAYGPFPADGFFGSSSRNQYDGILAMYHDQGLTAFKALAFEDGVNVTVGLPIVRTSPDHGTAFDIADKFVASESSMRNAVYQAIDIYRKRQAYKEMNANPLKITPPTKRNSSSEIE